MLGFVSRILMLGWCERGVPGFVWLILTLGWRKRGGLGFVWIDFRYCGRIGGRGRLGARVRLARFVDVASGAFPIVAESFGCAFVGPGVAGLVAEDEFEGGTVGQERGEGLVGGGAGVRGRGALGGEVAVGFDLEGDSCGLHADGAHASPGGEDHGVEEVVFVFVKVRTGIFRQRTSSRVEVSAACSSVLARGSCAGWRKGLVEGFRELAEGGFGFAFDEHHFGE